MDHMERLRKLVSLKIEGCSHVDAFCALYFCANESLEELSLQRCTFSEPSAFTFSDPVYTMWPLKLVDVSGNLAASTVLHYVMLDPESSVTHVYMEKSFLAPGKVPRHSRVEFISLAGCYSFKLFKMIDRWASHPTVKEINASGCALTDEQREELVRKHRNVVWNLSAEFQESARVKI